MIDARVGLGEAVKGALTRREKARAAGEEGLWSSIIGPLAELIEVEAEDAPAVEAALGTLVQGLVVPSAASLNEARELGALGGRVTFLPVSYTESSPVGAAPAIRRHPPHESTVLRSGSRRTIAGLSRFRESLRERAWWRADCLAQHVHGSATTLVFLRRLPARDRRAPSTSRRRATCPIRSGGRGVRDERDRGAFPRSRRRSLDRRRSLITLPRHRGTTGVSICRSHRDLGQRSIVPLEARVESAQ
jgi:hypothetical protein